VCGDGKVFVTVILVVVTHQQPEVVCITSESSAYCSSSRKHGSTKTGLTVAKGNTILAIGSGTDPVARIGLKLLSLNDFAGLVRIQFHRSGLRNERCGVGLCWSFGWGEFTSEGSGWTETSCRGHLALLSDIDVFNICPWKLTYLQALI
jgi:hypothetical protein